MFSVRRESGRQICAEKSLNILDSNPCGANSRKSDAPFIPRFFEGLPHFFCPIREDDPGPRSRGCPSWSRCSPLAYMRGAVGCVDARAGARWLPYRNAGGLVWINAGRVAASPHNPRKSAKITLFAISEIAILFFALLLTEKNVPFPLFD